MLIAFFCFCISVVAVVYMLSISHLNTSHHLFPVFLHFWFQAWLSTLLLHESTSCVSILITWLLQLHLTCIAAATASLIFIVLRMSSFLIWSLRLILSYLRLIFLWQIRILRIPPSLFPMVVNHILIMHIPMTSYLDYLLMAFSCRIIFKLQNVFFFRLG